MSYVILDKFALSLVVCLLWWFLFLATFAKLPCARCFVDTKAKDGLLTEEFTFFVISSVSICWVGTSLWRSQSWWRSASFGQITQGFSFQVLNLWGWGACALFRIPAQALHHSGSEKVFPNAGIFHVPACASWV